MKVYALAGIAFLLACGSSDTRPNLESTADGESPAHVGRADAELGIDAQPVDGGPNLMVDAGIQDDAGHRDGGGLPSFNPYQPRRPNRSCRLPEPPAIGGYGFQRAFLSSTLIVPSGSGLHREITRPCLWWSKAVESSHSIMI